MKESKLLRIKLKGSLEFYSKHDPSKIQKRIAKAINKILVKSGGGFQGNTTISVYTVHANEEFLC